MEYTRSHRVAEQIQKEVSTLLLKGLKDPRVEFVTITAVEVTSDLRLARIYFTAMEDERSRGKTEEGLKSAIPFIRRELGRRLRMRYVPDILFKYDTSLEYGSRIESLLQEIHSEENDGQGDPDEN